jgi:hypothetical protein
VVRRWFTTAISQNGVLDGFFVLASLSRIVWRISHIYNQKPLERSRQARIKLAAS